MQQKHRGTVRARVGENLFQEPSGRYVFSLRTDGKQRWIPCVENGVTLGKQEALQFKQRMLGQNPAERLLPSRATFKQLADETFATWRWRQSTLDHHHDVLRIYLKPLHGLKAQQITKHDLMRLVIKPMEDKGLAPNTVHQALMTASKVFERGMDSEPRIVRENPVRRLKAGDDKPLRENASKWRVLTAEEFAAVLQHASTDHFRVSYALMGLAGLRPSEACGLRWEGVLWAQGSISVTTQLSRKREDVDTKNRASTGDVDMSQTLRKILLAEHLRQGRPEHGYVTLNRAGRPCGQRSLGHSFMLTCKRAGLEEPWPTPHDLRRTFVSALIAAGLDAVYVSAQARHKNPHITMTAYAKEFEKRKKQGQAGDAIDEVFGPSLAINTKMM